jgi:hypothetical protein
MENLATNRNCICEGILYINEILSKVEEYMGIDESNYYDAPHYIFRGISKYYPTDETKKKKEDRYSIEEVENGFIRSGHSIRMQMTQKKYKLEKAYTRANYISGLQEMVSNARKHYPGKYTKDFTDLDILADIQHNGGATCLIDFSKNLLTSLWFACSEDIFDDGFIYCYDVMRDMIENDSLTYIRPENEKESIYNLIFRTHEETNISSDIDARFFLWEPSPHNNRILRQDSIFLFGIEQFHVKSHGIRVIRVNAEHKRNILFAMKSLFNISSSTIYNDAAGFATTNSKKMINQKWNDNAYNRGYVNMIKGHYSCALDFFKLWEGDNESKISNERKLELHFSLGVCYKNLYSNKKELIYYAENAETEYRKVISCTRKILRKNNLKTPQERAYYIQKCTRAYSGIMDMILASKKYKVGIKICDEIIKEINNGILKPEKNNSNNFDINSKKELNPKYCRIMKMELLDLQLISNWEDYSKQKSKWKEFSKKMDRFYDEAIKQKGNKFFDAMLIEYYKMIFDILIRDEDVHIADYKDYFVRWISQPRKEPKNRVYEGYVLWNFHAIKDAIDEIKGVKNIDKKNTMQYVTAHAISFRDKFQMQSWGRSEKV